MESKKPRILVVDDDPESREYLVEALTRHGYPVLTAQDGAEGLAQLREHDLDIVLCDLMMPNVDGLELLKTIRRITLRAEVIIVTGQSSADRCAEAIEQNAFGYLLKPLKLKSLLDSVRRAEQRVQDKEKMLKVAFHHAEDQRRGAPGAPKEEEVDVVIDGIPVRARMTVAAPPPAPRPSRRGRQR
jgi:DNA-binding NtrC family response regulator